MRRRSAEALDILTRARPLGLRAEEVGELMHLSYEGITPYLRDLRDAGLVAVDRFGGPGTRWVLIADAPQAKVDAKVEAKVRKKQQKAVERQIRAARKQAEKLREAKEECERDFFHRLIPAGQWTAAPVRAINSVFALGAA